MKSMMLMGLFLFTLVPIAGAQSPPPPSCEQQLAAVQAYAQVLGTNRNGLEGELAQAMAQAKALQEQVQNLQKQLADAKKDAPKKP